MKLKITFSILLPIIIFFTIKYFDNMEFLKIIPTLLSFLSFLFFLLAHLKKKKLILIYTQKFYKRKLTSHELEYISQGDIYWVYVTLLNTIIQVILAIGNNDTLWMFYSSIGWCVFFFIALSTQILYGKMKTRQYS